MTSADPIRRLADELTQVSARLHEISSELRAVQSAAPAPSVPPMPPPYAYPPPAHAWSAAQPSPAAPPEPFEPRPTVWERLSREGAGSRIVAWVGGVVTLAGVVLLLVLAIQRGYVGPVPRVLLGACLGAALLGVAMRLHRSAGGRVGAHAVAATGLAVLYLDIVAATAFYGYLPAWAGLAVGLGVAAVGTWFALRWDSQLLATFVVIGCAASAPLVTRDITLLVGFLLVLQIAASPAQLRKRWGGLAIAAGVPPVLAVLLDAAVTALGSDQDALTVATLCLVAGLAQIAVATANARLHVSDEVAIGLVLGAPLPTMVAALVVPRFTAVALLGALGAVLIAVRVARRFLGTSSTFADCAGAAGLAAAFEATCIASAGDVRALALLAGATLLALLAVRLRFVTGLGAAAVFGAGGLVVALGSSVRFDFVTIAPRQAVSRGQVVATGTTGLLLAVAALVIGWAAGRLTQTTDQSAVHTRWTLAGLVALYGAAAAFLAIGLAVSPDEHGFLVGHMLVTLSWTVGALVLLLRHLDSTPLRVAGLALVGAALAKLVLFDLASLSGIPRVLAFLGGGLVLLAAGARYAKLVSARS